MIIAVTYLQSNHGYFSCEKSIHSSKDGGLPWLVQWLRLQLNWSSVQPLVGELGSCVPHGTARKLKLKSHPIKKKKKNARIHSRNGICVISFWWLLQQITANLGGSNTTDLSYRFWKSDVQSGPHGVGGAVHLLEALRENLHAYLFWLMAPSSIFKAINDWSSPPHVASL